MFFVWFDGDRKRRPHLKLQDAMAEYQFKYGTSPRICLVNAADATAIAEHGTKFACSIQPVRFVSVNTFYLGGEDANAALAEMELAPVELSQAA